MLRFVENPHVPILREPFKDSATSRTVLISKGAHSSSCGFSFTSYKDWQRRGEKKLESFHNDAVNSLG
jgi:hypothetical protein